MIYFPKAISIPITGGITEGGAIIIAILIFAISVMAVILLVLWRFGVTIQKKMSAIGQDAAHARDQTKNHHDKNLRVDLDDKDEVQNKKLDKALEMLENNGARFDRMNDRITGLDRRMTGIDTRVSSLDSRLIQVLRKQ